MFVRKSFRSIMTILLLASASSINAECRNPAMFYQKLKNPLNDLQTTSLNLIEMSPSGHKDTLEFAIIQIMSYALESAVSNVTMTITLATIQREMKLPADSDKFTKLIEVYASNTTKNLSIQNETLNRFIPMLSNSSVLREVYVARDRIQELSRIFNELCGVRG